MIEPDAYVADLAVRTSVAADRLSVDVWLQNTSDRERTVVVHDTLASASARQCGRTKVTAATQWGLGRAS